MSSRPWTIIWSKVYLSANFCPKIKLWKICISKSYQRFHSKWETNKLTSLVLFFQSSVQLWREKTVNPTIQHGKKKFAAIIPCYMMLRHRLCVRSWSFKVYIGSLKQSSWAGTNLTHAMFSIFFEHKNILSVRRFKFYSWKTSLSFIHIILNMTLDTDWVTFWNENRNFYRN